MPRQKEITGNNIAMKDGELINKGVNKNAKNKSGDAAAYLDNLIGSTGVLTLDKTNKTSYGESSGDIYLNTDQIDDQIASVGKTMGFGMTFLHESLHTWTGTYAYDGENSKRTDEFGDPPKEGEAGFNAKAKGETVSIVNKFRNQLGWDLRDTYFDTNNLNSDGSISSTSMHYGSKDVTKVSMSTTDKTNRRFNAAKTYANTIMRKDINQKLKNKGQ